MAMNDYPELKVLFDKLWAEKQELVEEAKPFREEYDRLHKEAEPLEVAMREEAKKFRAIEQPRMAELDQQLSAIAKATGGLSLSQFPEGESQEVTKVDVGDVNDVLKEDET